jgi:hypothetical protein
MDRRLLDGKMRFSLGMLLALGLFLGPAAASATPATFTVSPTSFVGVTAAGTLAGTQSYAPGTTFNFDINYGAAGSAKPFTLSGFFLPSVSGAGVTYSFTGLPSVISGVIDIVSGALSTDPISGSVVRTPTIGSPSAPVPFGSPAFFLTTGNIPAGNCGGPYDSFSGSAVSASGSASILGTTCAAASPSLDGPWLVRLKLDGTFAPNPVPEPGTAVMLVGGLAGIGWMGRRRKSA